MNDLQTRRETPAPLSAAATPTRKSLVREYGEAIFIAILLALVIRQFAVQAFTIPSGSMMETLLIGDYILVNKFLFGAEIPLADVHLPGLRPPARGDIIVFRYPQDESRDSSCGYLKTTMSPRAGARSPGRWTSVRGISAPKRNLLTRM